jgi:hypothetical protein
MLNLLTIDGPPGCQKWKYAEELSRRLDLPLIGRRCRSSDFKSDRVYCLSAGWNWWEVREWLTDAMHHRGDVTFYPTDVPTAIAVENEDTAAIWATASKAVEEHKLVGLNRVDEEVAKKLSDGLSWDYRDLLDEVLATKELNWPDHVAVHRVHLDPGLESVQDKIADWQGAPPTRTSWDDGAVLRLADHLRAEYTRPVYKVVDLLDDEGCPKPMGAVIKDILAKLAETLNDDAELKACPTHETRH